MTDLPPDDLGREAELERIAAVLDARRPAVVALTGDKGSGKSYVTDRAVRSAVEHGWNATPYVGGRGVRVATGTTPAAMQVDVLRALGLGAQDRPEDEPEDDGPRSLKHLGARLEAAAEHAPVLVVLDPYLPSPELGRAIRRHLLPVVRSSAQPVVLLFVARRRLTAELRPDLEIEIDPPGVDLIERTLRASARGLEPALGDPELRVYVDAARDNPRLLASLAAVLPLSRRGAGHDISVPSRAAKRG